MKKLIPTIIIAIIVLFVIVNLLTGYNEASTTITNSLPGINSTTYCGAVDEYSKSKCTTMIALYNNDKSLCNTISGFNSDTYKQLCNETMTTGKFEFKEYNKSSGSYSKYDELMNKCVDTCSEQQLYFNDEIGSYNIKSFYFYTNLSSDGYVDEIFSCYCFQK